MRLMIMFDLPTQTVLDKKHYRDLRKALINEGFLMIQESVYVHVCVNSSDVSLLMNRIRMFVPTNGKVLALTVTEKQYNSIQYLSGGKSDDLRNSIARLIIL